MPSSKMDKPIILIECKWSGIDLDKVDAGQLRRYFSVTESRLGVLTNGVVYRFFSDLEKPNIMDSKAFLELDLLDIEEPLVDELKKFTKDSFDIDDILSTASELKYTREIKRILADQMIEPSDDFVKFFASAGVLRHYDSIRNTEVHRRDETGVPATYQR